MKYGAALTFLFVAGWPGAAATIDFDDLGVGTGGNILAPEFVSRGYLLSSLEHLHVINDLPPTTSWNGTAWLGIHDDGATANQVTLTRHGGGLFDLLSLDISEWFGYPNQVEVQITGTREDGGIVTRLLKVDDILIGPGPLADFQMVPFSSDWQNLSSVAFESVAGSGARWYSLDNIVTAEAVPEPSAGFTLLSGLALMGLLYPRWKRERPGPASNA
jgi:hypothetical protein